MSNFDELLEDLKQMRDELALRMKLASMEARDEWDELEKKWEHFSAQADLKSSQEGMGQALDHLADEMKKSYQRFKNAIND